jgi:ATPase component of various ABC-type transport system, contain duplicated ATPase
LLNNASDGGGNLGIDLIGGHLNQRLINGNGVTNGNKPAGNGTLGHGLAQCGQFYGVGHIFFPFSL